MVLILYIKKALSKQPFVDIENKFDLSECVWKKERKRTKKLENASNKLFIFMNFLSVK